MLPPITSIKPETILNIFIFHNVNDREDNDNKEFLRVKIPVACALYTHNMSK